MSTGQNGSTPRPMFTDANGLLQAADIVRITEMKLTPADPAKPAGVRHGLKHGGLGGSAPPSMAKLKAAGG